MNKKKTIVLVLSFLAVGLGPLLQAHGITRSFGVDVGEVGEAQLGVSQVSTALLPQIGEPNEPSGPAVVAKPQRNISYPVNPWEWIHSIARNTVVQVFTYHAEFNWNEPYKTPRQGMGAGSSFFIDKEGTLVTNYHVVEGQRGVYIQLPFFGKRRFDVKVIGACPERDLALLRVIPEDLVIIKRELGDLPILEFGDSDEVKRADEIMTLGYPLGQEWLKSTIGVVSGQQHIAGRYMIQIDAAINPGNSGGPSFDRSGKVIGVNTAGIFEGGAQNVGYIIPANEVKLFLQQLDGAPIANNVNFLRKPFLGGWFIDASENAAKYFGNPLPGGCYTVSVYKNGPLDKAGLKAGDMIYELDGHPVDYFGDIQVLWSEDRVSIVDYTSRLRLGDPLHIVYYRKGERREADITFSLTEAPPVRARYPDFEFLDYEVIGGLVVMELALNHIPLLIKQNPRLGNYMEFEKQTEPALIISHILPDSEAAKARVLVSGDLLKKVNGTSVKTLEEFRGAVLKSKETGYMTLDVDGDIFAVLSFPSALRDEERLSSNYYYRITPFVNGLIADAQKK